MIIGLNLLTRISLHPCDDLLMAPVYSVFSHSKPDDILSCRSLKGNKRSWHHDWNHLGHTFRLHYNSIGLRWRCNCARWSADKNRAFMLSLISCLVFVFQEGGTKHIIKNNLNVHSSTECMTKNLAQQDRLSMPSDFPTWLNRAALGNYGILISFSPFLLYILSFLLFFPVHCNILSQGDSKYWCVTKE